ncbi:MAG: ABC transporter ATP-binding protein [Ancrocorticia sp.]
MRPADPADPAGLGRGRLTRWMPVLLQAPAAPPSATPFEFDETTTPSRFLLRVLFSAKRLTIPAMVAFIASQVGHSAIPMVMGIAIDQAIATGDVARLVLWLAALAGVFLVIATGSRFSQQLVMMARQVVQHRLRATLSAWVLHPHGSNHKPDGGVVSLMTNDVFRLAGMGLVVFPIGEVVAIAFIAVSLLLIYWPLGLTVLIGAPLVVWCMGAMSGQYARSTRAYQTLLAASVGRAADLVAGYRVIKGVRAEAEATARYRQASQEALAGALANAGRLGRYLGGSGMVSGVFVAAVAALAGWFTLEGQMSIGELIAAAGLTQALIPQMTMVTNNAVPAWAAANASAGRVLDALREAASTQASTARVTELSAMPTLEVTIPGHGSIRVTPGQMIGLSAGDAVAAQVANALLDPRADEALPVLLDQVRAAEVEDAIYRSRVVAAPHAGTLFSGTIADNLEPAGAAGAAGSAQLQAVRSARLQAAALQAACCDDFATDTRLVGEAGSRLSGGQRQRVALARALATDAPVLVLHDPTTAVDSVTEARIAHRLRALRKGQSTLLITSSPVLLGVCDQVIKLDPTVTPGGDGVVVEEAETKASAS